MPARCPEPRDRRSPRPDNLLDEPDHLGERPAFTNLDDGDLEGNDRDTPHQASSAQNAVGHPPAPHGSSNGKSAEQRDADLEPVGTRTHAVQPQRGVAHDVPAASRKGRLQRGQLRLHAVRLGACQKGLRLHAGQPTTLGLAGSIAPEVVGGDDAVAALGEGKGAVVHVPNLLHGRQTFRARTTSVDGFGRCGQRPSGGHLVIFVRPGVTSRTPPAQRSSSPRCLDQPVVDLCTAGGAARLARCAKITTPPAPRMIFAQW